MDPSVLVYRRDGWTLLALNRPERLNAFNEEIYCRLADALDAAANDDTCRTLLLAGAGCGFCAGLPPSSAAFSHNRRLPHRCRRRAEELRLTTI